MTVYHTFIIMGTIRIQNFSTDFSLVLAACRFLNVLVCVYCQHHSGQFDTGTFWSSKSTWKTEFKLWHMGERKTVHSKMQLHLENEQINWKAGPLWTCPDSRHCLIEAKNMHLRPQETKNLEKKYVCKLCLKNWHIIHPTLRLMHHRTCEKAVLATTDSLATNPDMYICSFKEKHFHENELSVMYAL